MKLNSWCIKLLEKRPGYSGPDAMNTEIYTEGRPRETQEKGGGGKIQTLIGDNVYVTSRSPAPGYRKVKDKKKFCNPGSMLGGARKRES